MSRDFAAQPELTDNGGVKWRSSWSPSMVGGLIGLAVVGSVLFVSVAAPFLPFADPLSIDYRALLLPPSLEHPFGTDNLGRDVFSRTIYGARIDLQLGALTVLASMMVGICLGIAAGFYRGIVEVVIMRTVDALLGFPFLVLVLAIVAIVGPGLSGVYIGIIAVGWTVYARITFSEMLVLRERQFILAARTLGYSDARIIFRHALPNLVRANIAFMMSDVVLNILGLASLSYLGVGVAPPSPEWGALIASGQELLFTAWWVSIMPGVLIVVVGIGFSLLGEGLAEWFSVDTAGHRGPR